MGIVNIKINEQYSLKGNHYEVENEKAFLVIITGMDEHSERYEKFAKFLNQDGIDVYVLDHFGQGLNVSDPKDQQKSFVGAWDLTLTALNKEIKELRKFGLPVYLMGHSMGSFYVQSYLEHYPDTVDKAIIMGSNGPNKMLYSVANLLAKATTHPSNWNKPSRFMQNLALGGYAKSIKNRKTDLDWLSYNEENVKNYIADPYCGHINTCGFYHEFFKGMNTLYKKKYLKNISPKEKILIVSGSEDPVGNCSKGPISLKKMYDSLGVKDVTLIIYPHMRHEILNETNGQKPANDIKDFLLK
ncbi:MAG: alpha/beta fold hydrolase [Bacilli bacterium]